jgi:hypothetical protein
LSRFSSSTVAAAARLEPVFETLPVRTDLDEARTVDKGATVDNYDTL